MKTLLQIVQDFCGRTGLSVPGAVVGSTDDQIVQILGLLNEGLDDLAGKYKWPQLELEATFNSTLVELQGELETIAPGFEELITDTFWCLTTKLPASGSTSPQDTQTLKIWGSPGALVHYRLKDGGIYFFPAQTLVQQYRFEYRTRYLVWDNVDSVAKQYFTRDTDTVLIPDHLIVADLRWRWKCEKGLAYAENFRSFEMNCKQTFINSQNAKPLQMSTCGTKYPGQPGVVVPLGSWNTP